MSTRRYREENLFERVIRVSLCYAFAHARAPAGIRRVVLERAVTASYGEVFKELPEVLINRALPPEFGRRRRAELRALVSSPTPLGFGILCFLG